MLRCFAYNRLGHKSYQCRLYTKLDLSPPISNTSDLQAPWSDLAPIMARHNIPTFFSSDASLHFESTFENSPMLTDSAGLGKIRIEAALRNQMPHHHRVARYYNEMRFLIEAPKP